MLKMIALQNTARVIQMHQRLCCLLTKPACLLIHPEASSSLMTYESLFGSQNNHKYVTDLGDFGDYEENCLYPMRREMGRLTHENR